MIKNLIFFATAILLPLGLSTQTIAQTDAQPAAPVPNVPFDTSNPLSWAPLTEFPVDKLPAEIADATRIYENITGPANTKPIYGIQADMPYLGVNSLNNGFFKRPKTCLPQKQKIVLKWVDYQNALSEEAPIFYIGDAVNCSPQGQGIIVYKNGTAWIGKVTDLIYNRYAAKNGNEKAIKKDHEFVMIMPIGKGIVRTSRALKSSGGQVINSIFQTVPELMSSSWSTNGALLSQALKLKEPLAYLRIDHYTTGLNGSGSGLGNVFLQDGGRISGIFENGQLKDSMGKYFLPNGDERYGRISGMRKTDVQFSGVVEETLKQPDVAAKIPPGKYQFFHIRQKGVTTRELIRPLGETLLSGGSKPENCKEPTLRPEGWVTFWPMCRDQTVTPEGKTIPASVVTFSPDGAQMIWEYFHNETSSPNGKENFRFFWAQLGPDGNVARSLDAHQLTTSPMLAPVGIARLADAKGQFEFKGEFLGLIPNGPGTCRLLMEKDEEPCFYANGARTDEIHLARQELKAIELAAKQESERLAAEQAETNRRIEQERQNEQIRLAEAQRQARQAEIDAENAEIDAENAARGDPIMNAIQDVGQKFKDAALDQQRRMAEIDRINAEQRRLAAARANAARQAQGRSAQANEDARQAQSQQIANAQAMAAAEIQRRQAAATARLETAKQKAATDRANAIAARDAAAAVSQSSSMRRPSALASGPVSTIEWLEGIVVCPAKEGFLGSTKCFGPQQMTMASLSSKYEIGHACGTGSTTGVRDMGTVGGNRIFGCMYGINPTLDRSPHVDQAARFGITVPNRRVYRCPEKQTTICR
jgi:hypothetical protein